MASGLPASACSPAWSCSCSARRRCSAAAKRPAPLSRQTKEITLYGVGLAAVAVIWGLVQYQDVIQNLLIVSGVGLLGYVVYEAFKLDKHARDRIFAILFLIALNPLFWGLFEQAGGSFNLYTDRFVDRAGVPASIFQSINPIYIILLAPLFAGLWVMLGRRGLEPSAPAKFGLALAPGRPRLPGVRVGRQFGRPGRDDPGHLRLPALFAAHHRRIVPVARSASAR